MRGYIKNFRGIGYVISLNGCCGGLGGGGGGGKRGSSVRRARDPW